MKRIKLILIMLIFVLCPIFSNNYKIEDFDLTMNVGKDNVLHIEEELIFNFFTQRHGFYQSIPYGGYPGYNIKVNNIKVSDDFEVKKNSEVVAIKVGSSDKVVEGINKYKLSYDYDIGKDIYPDYDEIYFNLVGTDWLCPIDSFTFKINLPFEVDKNKVWLTSGNLGSTKYSGSYKINNDLKSIEGEINNLNPNEAVTIRIELPEGSFSGFRDPNSRFIYTLLIMIILSVLSISLSFVLFSKYGKDKKIIERSRFTPPDGFSPSKLDFLLSRTINIKTLTSMIFYWADKGYLTIHQKDKKNIKFILIKDSKSITDRSEKFLFKALFNQAEIGEEFSLDDFDPKKFQTYFEEAKKSESQFFENKFENKKSSKAQTKILLVGLLFVILSSLSFYITSKAIVFSILLMGVIYFVFFSIMFDTVNKRIQSSSLFVKILLLVVFSLISLAFFFVLFSIIKNEIGLSLVNSFVSSGLYMVSMLFLLIIRTFTSQRSEYYQIRLEEVEGYKKFIEFVEIDKLEKMIEEDPSLYFNVLSYAQVLNLTRKWQNKFKELEIIEPSWYYCSSYSHFSAYYFYSGMYHNVNNSINGAFSKAFSNSSSSGGFTGSSSGFSGSAGGGFGGGGGGAW